MPFLRNAWYVAAWSHEIRAGELFARRFLGEPVLLFRTEAGEALAVSERCPHRFAPLSKGSLQAGRLRCGYHGLEFDSTGTCVHNPHGEAVPKNADLKSYPVREEDGLVWIWMGEPDDIGDRRPLRFACLDPNTFAIGTGYLLGAAHYELMTDNILDLSHIQFLHPNLGTEAVARAKIEVRDEGDSIVCERQMRDELLSPLLATSYRTEGKPVDRTLSVKWHAPAMMHLTVTVVPAGRPREESRFGSQSLHLFTPETETTTHYFYSGSRNYELENQDLTNRFIGALRMVFETEDKPMIEAQQAMMGTTDLMSLAPVSLSVDTAAIRARRALGRLIAREQEQASR
jgi:phenylpropionate dioxygenase-like ring-hydroxylating dioxygenase large terminal subunit